MAKAKKLPSGQWRTLVYSHSDSAGKRHYESFTAYTKKESEYLAAEFALNKRSVEKSDLTFGDAFDKYIAGRESVLSPRTIYDYKRIRDSYFPELMDVRIEDITQELIQIIISEDSRNHSPKTVRNHHGLISSIIHEFRPNFSLNTVLPKKVRPNLYIPQNDDVKKLLAIVTGTEMELPVLLAAFGPMRRGEICALDSSHIVNNIVHVEKNMVLDSNRNWVIKAPKSYSGNRYIEFPDFVAEKWKNLPPGRLVQMCPDNITSKFGRILKKANIPHFRFHDLRHYSASIQHAMGIPDAYIMQRGGWGTDTVLKSVYRHAMDQEQEKNNKKINGFFTEMQHEMQHEI